MKYRIYYGSEVPYKNEDFKTWGDACAFMKNKIDAGIRINSVGRLEKDDT